jgi:hypothetical protein
MKMNSTGGVTIIYTLTVVNGNSKSDLGCSCYTAHVLVTTTLHTTGHCTTVHCKNIIGVESQSPPPPIPVAISICLPKKSLFDIDADLDHKPIQLKLTQFLTLPSHLCLVFHLVYFQSLTRKMYISPSYFQHIT